MDNKRYLDRIIGNLLNETNIDYDKKQITGWPFSRNGIGFNLLMSEPEPDSLYRMLRKLFYNYCKIIYGLTQEESKYVWKEYINMLKEIIILIGGDER